MGSTLYVKLNHKPEVSQKYRDTWAPFHCLSHVGLFP